MRAREFIIEYSTAPKEGPVEDFEGLQFKMTVYGFYNQINVSAFIPKSKKEIAHVLFDILDYRQLEPLDLHVNEKYRGQGIAKTLYDYVKSKGYAIHRSWDQTEAGARFWNKHRGEDGQLWESDLTVGRNLSPATEKYIKSHKWKLTTVDPMSLDIDSFDDPFNRVIDIDTEHSVDFNDPIIVHGNGTTIIDGFHRVYQAQQQGLKKLPAYVPVEQNVNENISGIDFLDNLLRLLQQRYPDAKFERKRDRVVSLHDDDYDDDTLGVIASEHEEGDYVGCVMWDVSTGPYTGVLMPAIKLTTEQLLRANPGKKPALFITGDNNNPEAWSHIAQRLGYRLVTDEDEDLTEDIYGVKRNVTQFLDSLTPDDVGVDIVGPYRIHYEGFNDDCKSSEDYCQDPDQVYQQVFADHIKREKGQQPLEQNMVGDEEYPILYSIFRAKALKEGRENFNGIDLSLEIQKDDEYVDDDDYENQVIYVQASAGGRELGHVLFVNDGEYLLPQDLEVEEQYRGQGIAQTMYDFVKSKGYKIRRSGQQTDAGAGFWAKHRPEQNVWEQGVVEGLSNSITYKQQKGKNKFSIEMLVDGKPAGIFQYDANTGRTLVELDPSFRKQGLGQLLILKGIHTAVTLGMDYVEDESRTEMFDRSMNSLADAGYIVNDDEYWYVTDRGEQFLKQGVTEGKDFDTCFDKACKLYDKAEHKNLEPKLVQVADFKGDSSGADKRWTKLPQHVWQHYVVIVGDKVLDPTARQFGPDMPTKYNVSDLDKLWGKQYVIRPREDVNELFQPGKKNWKWKFRGSEEAMAQFTVGDRDYMWSAYNHYLDERPDKWEIQFRLLRKDIDPEIFDFFGTTGTGNSTEVMSTVIDITREFLHQYISGINEITFNAKENSRIALYRKMIKRLLPNWELEEDYTTHDGLKFTLYKPKEM